MDTTLLKQLYLEERLSQHKIAKRLGCSQTNVRYWLKKLDIKRNQKHTYDSEETKTCPQCKVEKSSDDFYKRSNGLPGSWCKGCMSKQVVIRQRKYKAWAVAYKGGACEVCARRALRPARRVRRRPALHPPRRHLKEIQTSL